MTAPSPQSKPTAVEGSQPDIVERLRDGNAVVISGLFHAIPTMREAADRIEELTKALTGLTNCADGFAFAERDVRLAVGNTNWSVLQHWIAESRRTLSPPLEQSGSGK